MAPIAHIVQDCLAIVAVCAIGLLGVKILLGLFDRVFGRKDDGDR